MLARVAIGLLAGTLLAAPALAQTAPAPAGGQPAAPAAQPAPQSGGSGVQYITQGRPDMWRASQLDGVDIYNNNNEKIGDISDVLVDQSGKVEAVVIGVGGFLGIGERNVAVPFNALKFEMTEPSASASNTGGAGGSGTMTTTSGTNTTGGAAGTANQPATTGTVAGGNNAGGNNANTSSSSNRNAPARAILANASRDELKNAPEFKFGNQ
jgi:sporulation protein YlmC with PRC-barrel domain